ncbi:MAG: hypothetical protein AAF741_10180 [Bacteroidota bacterium]
MKTLINSLAITTLFLLNVAILDAHVNPEAEARPSNQNNLTTSVDFRSPCNNPVTQFEQQINNVRARLTTGGDVWWDGNDGRYVVPKPPAGVIEVSSIFAGSVWLGGRDVAGNPKIAAQQFGRPQGNFDYYTGPLTPEGTTSADTCANWDQFFVVTGSEIREFLSLYNDAVENDALPLSPDDIPDGVKGWPATGNPFFADVHGFDLPETTQSLAGFWNQDADFSSYDPTLGDFPVIEIRGCNEEPQFPDQMIFWIYNDAGNIHRESSTDQIQMEIQVQAFSYSRSDDINNMTFQRYKLINRGTEDLINTYFAMWVDADLGCFTDDYVGCDTTRSLAIVYNEDELDGTNGCTCEQGVPTYCDRVPLLGVDYFRGPLDEFGQEIGMSSFIYTNNRGIGSPDINTTDPQNGEQYYNILQGLWLDGSCLQEGGDGFDEGTPCTRYAFPDPPNLDGGWSMAEEALPFGDRRTIQASGPFTLLPGAVNELIIGVVWVPDQPHPAPSLRRLNAADDLAQDLFDNCFKVLEGPDAPNVDWVELNNEVIAVLSNPEDEILHNNANESYEEEGFGVPDGADPFYRFEGYRIFQLANPSVDIAADRLDPDKVRIVGEVDVANGVTKVFNWTDVQEEDLPPAQSGEGLLTPSLITEGADRGIRNTFSITNDAFATGGNTSLINHRRYYFTVLAYAYNNYKDYDPSDSENPGQPIQYLESSRFIGETSFDDNGNSFYTVIPRPILDRELMANYGDGPSITRLAGLGNNGNELRLNEETSRAIEEAFAGGENQISELTYEPGFGPIDVKVYDPRNVVDGSYELTMVDSDISDDDLEEEATWMLDCLDDCGVATILSEKPINFNFEQIIPEYGFSVTILDNPEPGELPSSERNGTISQTITYSDPDGDRWLSFIPDETFPLGPDFGALNQSIYNYVNTGFGERFEFRDEEEAFEGTYNGIYPYVLMDWEDREAVPPAQPLPYISPVFLSSTNTNFNANRNMSVAELNNVDIVLTSDKSLWSRCPVIETASTFYDDAGFEPEQPENPGPTDEYIMFDRRFANSVSREARPDNPNLPAEDLNTTDEGYGWFPGYAVDVETGRRLQLVFGENSVYDGSITEDGFALPDNGADMIWNPSSTVVDIQRGVPLSIASFVSGGQHFFYVTQLDYDEGETIGGRLGHTSSPVPTRKTERRRGIPQITWAAFPLLTEGTELLSYADGLIPNDVRISLRVNSAFDVSEDNEVNNGYPTYQFSFDDVMAGQLDEVGIESALDQINVVPNPYYGFSAYEDGVFDTEIKITNLPAKCVVTIYSLEGQFIRQYNRDESEIMLRGQNRALESRQINPALTWDLKNFRGIPIASGVYLVHVAAPGLGERTLKWFGVNRQFDPSGL